MPYPHRPLASTLGFLALLLLIASCGSSGDGDATATPTPVAGLQSYRYELAATAQGVLGGVEGAENASLDIKVAGEVAAPDQEHVTTRMTLGSSSVQVERIRIGDQAWTRDSQQPWVQGAAGDGGGSGGIGIDTSALLGRDAHARLTEALDGLTPEDDQIDGADVLRYRLPADRLRMILGVSPDSSQTSLGRIEGDSTLWVTKDERLPVRLTTTATPTTGGTVEVEVFIRDRNEPIEIRPPAVG